MKETVGLVFCVYICVFVCVKGDCCVDSSLGWIAVWLVWVVGGGCMGSKEYVVRN